MRKSQIIIEVILRLWKPRQKEERSCCWGSLKVATQFAPLAYLASTVLKSSVCPLLPPSWVLSSTLGAQTPPVSPPAHPYTPGSSSLLPTTLLFISTSPPLSLSHHAMSQHNCQSWSPWLLCWGKKKKKQKTKSPVDSASKQSKEKLNDWRNRKRGRSVWKSAEKLFSVISTGPPAHHLPTLILYSFFYFFFHLTRAYCRVHVYFHTNSNTLREKENRVTNTEGKREKS